MEELVVYILSFGFVYLSYLFLVINRDKKRNLYRNSTEFLYLEKRYKLNVNKLNMKRLAHILALANAFIIANTVLIIGFINNYFVKLLVGLIIIIPMILIVYHLIGTYYQKKGVK